MRNSDVALRRFSLRQSSAVAERRRNALTSESTVTVPIIHSSKSKSRKMTPLTGSKSTDENLLTLQIILMCV